MLNVLYIDIMLISDIAEKINIEFKTLNMWCNRNNLVKKINGKSHIDPNDKKFVNYVKKKHPDFDFSSLEGEGSVAKTEIVNIVQDENGEDKGPEYWKSRKLKADALRSELQYQKENKDLIPIETLKTVERYCELIGTEFTNYAKENSVFFKEIGVQKMITDINRMIDDTQRKINKML